MKKILVTGGAGFIGSNFILYMMGKYPNYQIINLDLLSYAGNLENLKLVEKYPTYRFIKGDISDSKLVNQIFADGIDWVVNFAAESHVDRSIEDPDIFVKTNIYGTYVLLEAAQKFGIKKYLQISTDEVYGSLGTEGKFIEKSPLTPNSPYSASKASADLLVRAYYKTYQLPVVITRCSNNYGPYQFPEKLIPLFITNALEDMELPLYGDGLNIRDWIYVEDHCRALDLVLHQGEIGQVYNIGGDSEKTNLQITQVILEELGRPDSLIKYVSDRPGHDRRYAVDFNKLKTELNWAPLYTFEEGLRKTVQWYEENIDWWKRIKQGVYRDYYQKMYVDR